MDMLQPLRLAEKRAKFAWHTASAKLLAAELEAANVPTEPTADGQLTYTPAWKIAGRPNLSEEGGAAIFAAYDRGMRPAEVARLFRISERAALNWQRRWHQAHCVSSDRGAEA